MNIYHIRPFEGDGLYVTVLRNTEEALTEFSRQLGCRLVIEAPEGVKPAYMMSEQAVMVGGDARPDFVIRVYNALDFD